MTQTIVGLFERWADAQAAVHEIEAAGVRDREISIIGNRSEGEYVTAEKSGPAGAALEGAGTGAASGGMIGAGVGLLAGLGALAIPGIGPIVGAGPIVAALTGAGVGAATGAVTGGLVGALSGLGVPAHHAGYYEEGVRRGGTLVIVRCSEIDHERVLAAMNRHNVVDIEERARRYSVAAPTDAPVVDAYRHAPVEMGGRLDSPDIEEDPRTRENARVLAGVASQDRPERDYRVSETPRDPIMTDDSTVLETEEDRAA
jgi:hypothetical protein